MSAVLSAIFKGVDEISSVFEKMAASGERAVNQWESASSAASSAFEQATTGADSAAKSMDEAASSTGHWTSAVSDAASDAAGSLKNYGEEAEDAGEKSEQAGEKGKNATQTLAAALTSAGIAKMIHEVAGAFLVASDAAAEFETVTMKVSTIADTTQVSLSTISSDLLALSMETGQSVNALADATYSALSASVETASAVEFTATANKLATGGFTSSATAVDVLTTALNAYGLEVEKAESISDMLITTQNLGKTTVDELASSVGKVIPLASAYGVEMDNLSAAYAELTKGGIATAESTTYLKGMLTELGDSGSTVAEILQEQTGMGFSELMKAGYSLGDVLAVLGDSVNGDSTAFSNLWSSTEAGIGALALYNSGAAQFNTTLEAMQNSVGATQAAYDAMTDTTAHAQEELSNAAANLQISIGQNINPLMEKLYGLGTSILKSITSFTQEHPVITKAIAAIGIGLGVAAAAMVAITFATTTAIPAITAFGVALNTALGPIGWVALGITAVVAAGAAFMAMISGVNDETEGMTATTRAQYYELQDLNAEYEAACEQYGETSEEALRLKYQVDDLSNAFESNRQTLEEFNAEVSELCESTHKLTDDFNSALTEIKGNEAGALALIQKYEDLATKANRTGAEQQALEAVTKSLTQSYPELTAQLDNATLSVDEYINAMRRSAQQQADQQRQEQAQQTYVDALQKRAELTEELEKAQANYNAELEAHGMVWDETMQTYSNGWYTADSPWASWTTDLDDYKTALDDLTAAQAENEATIAQIEEGWAAIAEAENAAADETMTWEEAAATAYENVRTRVEELCAAYDEAYEAAVTSFEGQFGLFDQASTESEEYMNATVANAQAALDSQLAYWETYGANIETLKSTSAEDLGITQENYDALMAYAQDGSEQAAGFAASMAEAINAGDTEAIATLANTVGAVTSAQQEIAAATADWKTNFTAEMDAIEQEMQSTIDGMNLSTEASASATATITSYADSIRAGKTGAVAAAQEVAAAVSAALAKANANINVNVSSGGAGRGYATGTESAAPGVALVGEEGPELVYFNGGEQVFTADETNQILARSADRHVTVSTDDAEEIGSSERDVTYTAAEEKRITLDINGSGELDVTGADEETVWEIVEPRLKTAFMGIVRAEIFEEGDRAYAF